MSADNAMAVIKVNKKWYVANVQAMENFSYDPIHFLMVNSWTSFESKKEANEYAISETKKDIFEYGVCELDNNLILQLK